MSLKNIILFLLRLRFKLTRKDTPIDFCEQLRSSHNFVISVPALEEEKKALQRYLKKLPVIFPDAEIFFIFQNGQRIPPHIRPEYVINITRDKLRYNIYPRREILSEINKISPDVYIDFNKQFNFVSTVLAAHTSAKIRVCMEDERREPFFNLQIKSAPESKESKGYKSVLHFLESCQARVYD